VLCENVDKLALAFVTPLGPQHYRDSIGRQHLCKARVHSKPFSFVSDTEPHTSASLRACQTSIQATRRWGHSQASDSHDRLSCIHKWKKKPSRCCRNEPLQTGVRTHEGHPSKSGLDGGVSLGGSTTLGPSALWGRIEERKENAETNHHPRTLQPLRYSLPTMCEQ
jgi:hypothetical protein